MSEPAGFMAMGPDGPKHFETIEEAVEFFQELGKTVEGSHIRVAHEIEQFYESLSEAQIISLRTLIMAAIESHAYGHEVVGRLVQLRSSKFNFCVGCGTNHEDELQKMMSVMEGGATGVEPENLLEKTRERLIENIENNESSTPGRSPKMQLLEEYRLNIVHGMDPPETYFACANCGLRYPTLEDRMLKEPGIEGCDGCIQKAKFGG